MRYLYRSTLMIPIKMKYKVTFKSHLSLTDILALDRTRLANERTFLAYFRSFVVFLSSGLAIVKLDILKDILWIGYLLIVIGPVLLFIGAIRFYYVRRHIKKMYDYDGELPETDQP
ncbi:DUF202 domain-containing protein [Robertkochia marina]|nr:DUF202 domain-containing protein [Robertkochia marina]